MISHIFKTKFKGINDFNKTVENESILKKTNQNGFVFYMDFGYFDRLFVYQTGRILDDNLPVFSLVTNVVKSSLSICIRSAPMFSIHRCSISATISSFAFITD